MNRQESFEAHWAETHDVPPETMVQYRWKEQDGYRLPAMASAYRSFCAGWLAANFNRANFDITIAPMEVERIREEIARLTDPMITRGPHYE